MDCPWPAAMQPLWRELARSVRGLRQNGAMLPGDSAILREARGAFFTSQAAPVDRGEGLSVHLRSSEAIGMAGGRGVS